MFHIVRPGVISAGAGFARAGTVRELAVVGDNRVKAFPDVPTFRDQGYDIDCPAWLGVFAPKGLHPVIAKKLEAGLKQGAESPFFYETCDKLLFIPRYMDSETFTKMVLSSYDRQAVIMKKIGFID